MRSSIHSPAYAALRELLVAARRTAGLSQEDVARRLGRPQSFVAKYEGGERKLDVIEFIALAGALEQDPVQLFESLVEGTNN